MTREIIRTIPRGPIGHVGPAPTPVWTGGSFLSFNDASGNPMGAPVNVLGPEGPAGDFQNFKTRDQAIASVINPALASIRVERWGAGYPLAPAIYIPGTSTGPLAFQDVDDHWWQLDLSGGQFNLLWAGVRGGGADDSDAIQLAVNLAAGKMPIFVPPAAQRYLVSRTINLPRGTVFFSYSNAAGFGVYGVDAIVSPMFYDEDGGGCQFSRVGLVGNSKGVTGGSGGAFWMRLDGAADILDGPTFSDCYFDNFAAENWIKVDNIGTNQISGGGVYRSKFVSRAGNSLGNASIGIAATMIQLSGNITNLTGAIISFKVDGNDALGIGVKNFFSGFANTRSITITNNTGQLFGFGANNNVASYFIMFYSNYGYNLPDPTTAPISERVAARPSNYTITGNVCINTRDTGIYGADVFDAVITDNQIAGTINDSPAGLPIGGISINGGENIIIDDNIIDGVASTGITSIACRGHVVIGGGNIIRSAQVGISGAVVSPVVNGLGEGHTKIGDLRIDLTGADSVGISLVSGISLALDTVEIGSPRIRAKRAGIVGYGPSASPLVVTKVKIGSPDIAGGFALAAISLPNCNARIEIGNPIIDQATGTGDGLDLRDCPNISVGAPEFLNFAADHGYCWNNSGTKGTIRDTTYQACSPLRLVVGGGLGSGNPGFNWTGIGFVRNLAPGEAGVTGSKYITRGWQHLDNSSATWLDCRELTGN